MSIYQIKITLKLNTYQINRYEKVRNEHLSNKNKDAILAANL